MTPINSWGRLCVQPHKTVVLTDFGQATRSVCAEDVGIAFGMGRSYGDACLNDGGVVWKTTGLDHLIRFERTTGQLFCEAGVLLRDIQQLVVPEGWMLPVSP